MAGIKPFHHRPWRAWDVETTGKEPEYALQPWSKYGRVRSFAEAWFNDTQQVCRKVTRPHADLDELRLKLATVLGTGKYVVGWNVAFDAAWAINLGLREHVMRTKWLDGMLLWKHLERFPESDINRSARKKYGLKDAVAQFYPQYAGYAEGVEFHGDLTDEQWAHLLKYNQLDAVFTLKLAERFYNQLRKEPQTLRNAMVEAEAIPEVADHYVRGLYVDREYCEDLHYKVTAEREALNKQLIEHGLTPTVLASPKQLQAVLYEQWELPVVKTTDKGQPSTDKDALDQLAAMDDRIALIAEQRELGNLRTKFVDKILASISYNSDSRTHPTANLGGTYTGRMTFSSFIGKTEKDKRQTGFAIHQMSSQPRYRKQIIPPPGYSLVELDAAGQEYRWMAIASGDQTMLELCLPGEDPHASMGADVSPDWEYRELQAAAKTGDPKAYKDRKCGKVCNLSCQYRIGKPKFRTTARVQYGVNLSVGEAAHFHNQYHRKYRGVKQYWKRAIHEAKIEGRATTFAGRHVQLKDHWFDPNKGWMLESAAINFPIQGTGADQKFLAIAHLRELCVRVGAYFYFELHDGIYYIVPTRKAMAFGVKAREILTNMDYEKHWGFQPPIPLPWGPEDQ
jgi:DNA polymerase I-like protein with 3'-5' exonuclease and polymerase domains